MRTRWAMTWLGRLALCALIIGFTVGPVRAQQAAAQAETAPNLSEARALFQRGVALADQRQFAGAAQRFREALAIHYAPAVAYNLAAALFELKQYDESFDQVQTVLRDASTPPELRERAQKLEQALSSYVARLTVLASGSGAEGAIVRLDGQVLDPKSLGVARAVAAGTHRVSAERRGERVSERSIEVPSGTAVIVDVSLIVTDPDAAGLGPPASSAGPVDEGGDAERARKRKIWIWTGVAAGVVVLGTGVALAVVLTRDDPGSAPAAQGDFMPGVLTWR